MSVELDHVFVLTSVGAPEADRLVECGLVEGPPNTHPSRAPLSPEADAVQRVGVVKFIPGSGHIMEIGFDGESSGRTFDFRPELPLRLLG